MARIGRGENMAKVCCLCLSSIESDMAFYAFAGTDELSPSYDDLREFDTEVGDKVYICPVC